MKKTEEVGTKSSTEHRNAQLRGLDSPDPMWLGDTRSDNEALSVARPK